MQSRLSLFTALSFLPFALAAVAFPRGTSSHPEVVISGPFATGINCTTVYSWTGGTPPYTATFSNIDTPGRVVPIETYADIMDTSFTWIPHNNDTGQKILLTISDEQGDEGSFDWLVVSTQIVC